MTINGIAHFGLLYPDTAIRADVKYMTLTFTKNSFDFRLEPGKHSTGNKCLDSTGESAAVNAVCASALQEGITQSQRNSNFLLCHGSGRIDIL